MENFIFLFFFFLLTITMHIQFYINKHCHTNFLIFFLTALSTIAAPSAGTLQNMFTFLVRVPALGAAMAESAVCNSSTRATVAKVADQERGRRGERGQGLILSLGKSVKHEKCHIFDADQLYIRILSKFTIFL